MLEGLLGDEPLPEEADATALQLKSLYTGRTQTLLKMKVSDPYMLSGVQGHGALNQERSDDTRCHVSMVEAMYVNTLVWVLQSSLVRLASHLLDNGESRSRLRCNLCCLALQALALRDTFDESLTPFPAPSYLQTLAAVG